MNSVKSYITLLLVVFTLTIYCQPTAPILQIETGMHTATSRRISTDAEGKHLLTCSDDKTARLWDASTGTLLNTFRIPIGSANEGKIFACSLSPDGKIAALGGYTVYEWDNVHSIYLVNTQTGGIIHRIKGLPNVIQELEFSPDGRWLAAGLCCGNGVRIFDTGGWGEYKKLEGYGSDVYNIAFKPGGGLATVCYDGKIRSYDSRFELLVEKSGLPGQEVYSLAFNPTGSLLAIGYDDASAVEVRDAADLSLLYKPSVQEMENKKGGFNILSFSADGSKLYGGGGFQKPDKEGTWKYVFRCWMNAGKGSYSDLLLMNNSITDIKPLPNGSMAMVGSYPDMAITNSSNEISWYLSAGNNNYAANDKSHFRVNASGSSIGFTPLKEQAYSFDVFQRKLLEEQSLYSAPVDANAGIAVTDWKSNYSPAINGKKVSFIRKYETCFSTDISSNGKQIVLGTGWNIYLSDNNGEKKWETALHGAGWTVNISGNDKVVAAAMNDGTIRWYRMSDGKELLTFYLHADKKRWVLFTPSGYYDASSGAEEFLGWHLNNGPDNAPSFFPVSRFKEKYYRPDIIDAIFETYKEEDAITLANSRSSKKIMMAEASIREKLPPTVIISSPSNGSNISSNTVSISYAINSPLDAPAKNLRVLIDGRPVATERGLKPTASATQKITITVPSQNCIITLLAENDNGTSPETNLYLKWVAPVVAKEEFIYKPKLYVLAIGVSDYNNSELKLGFAAKDAGDFANAIYKQKGNLYSEVIVKKLTNKEATKDAMIDGLDWIQKQTGQKDVAMIFYAGHGINDNNGVFYMLPVAADLERIRATCLNFEELKQTVSSIAGKVVVFIDACHSGNVMGSTRRGGSDINAVVNELSSTENGAITFTSSTGKEFSLEDAAWGNGAFTKAVIEGLNGKAVINGKNKITVKSLDAYISERVKELTKGKQHPTSVSPPNVPDFPIAVTQ